MDGHYVDEDIIQEIRDWTTISCDLQSDADIILRDLLDKENIEINVEVAPRQNIINTDIFDSYEEEGHIIRRYSNCSDTETQTRPYTDQEDGNIVSRFSSTNSSNDETEERPRREHTRPPIYMEDFITDITFT